MRLLDARQLVFVDECVPRTPQRRGVTPELPRTREPTVASPVTASENTTLLLASMGVEGMGGWLVVEGATTKVIFEAYVERVLAPALSPGQLVEGRGCELRYLPPYSPDFSPIEEAFSKLKAMLK